MPREAGISYVETLLAVIILGAAIVPAVDALRTGFMGANVSEAVLVAQHQLASRLEEVLAEPFAALDAAAEAAGSESTPSSYSDLAGPDRVLVFLCRYDGDDADGNGNPFDGTDAGLVWVRVAIENTPYELTTLVAQ